jgi:hypothetical protein
MAQEVADLKGYSKSVERRAQQVSSNIQQCTQVNLHWFPLHAMSMGRDRGKIISAKADVWFQMFLQQS